MLLNTCCLNVIFNLVAFYYHICHFRIARVSFRKHVSPPNHLPDTDWFKCTKVAFFPDAPIITADIANRELCEYKHII